MALRPEEAPPETVWLEEESRPTSIRDLEQGFAVQPGSLALDDLVGGYQSLFRWKHLIEGNDPPSEEVRGLTSLVLLFRSAEAAREFLELPEGEALPARKVAIEDLGDDARASEALSEGARPRILSIRWVRDRMFLMLNAFGEIRLSEARSLANVMDRRAARLQEA